jgi:acetylglutamate kinase
MLPEVAAVRRASDAGVASPYTIDGRIGHTLLLDVLTGAPCGTKIVT